MGNEKSYAALGLKVWKAQVDRAGKLFGTLSSEQVLQEIAWQKQAGLLVGTSDSHTRRDAAAAGAGETTLSRV